jgi:hypothetical protein
LNQVWKSRNFSPFLKENLEIENPKISFIFLILYLNLLYVTFCQFFKKGLLGNVSFFGEFSHCDDPKKKPSANYTMIFFQEKT